MRNSSRIVLFCAFCALFCFLSQTVAAQDFRVFTRVFDESSPVGKPRVVSRSVSLFHAKKVYDYIDGVGEVCVFSPVERRFTILDGTGQTATVLTFDELKHMIELAEEQALNRADKLAEKEGETAEAVQLLKFLVSPDFKIRVDETSHTLYLTSSTYSYTVRYVSNVDREFVNAYLDYADWAARLNAVLHPHSLLPAPRLKLNELLRERGLMPVEISLQVGQQEPLRLRAEHEVRWSFDRGDRSNISHWETLLNSRSLQLISFPAYQRRLLLSKTSSPATR